MALLISTSAAAFQGQKELPALYLELNKIQLQNFSVSIAKIFLQKDLFPGLTVALAQDGEVVLAKG